MSKISRNTFLKQSLKAGAFVMFSPLGSGFLTNAAVQNGKELWLDEDILKRLVTANDAEVANVLEAIRSDKLTLSRKIGYDFAALAASYVSAGSKYYQDRLIVPALEKLVELLLSFQSEDGTLNLGNLESPPDTAFLLEPLSAGAWILAKQSSNDLGNVNNQIKKFILKSGEALIVGGIHTPNHRWVVSAALAQLNALYPNKKYVDRINEWLSEGVFIDNDGHFPERSRIYSSVEDAALITMGRLLNRQSLFVPVRKNLDTTYYYMEPNGDLVTTDSRRQDQWLAKDVISYYPHYRYLAIKDNNGKFAAIARLIEKMEGFEEQVLARGLFHFLENPLLQKELPASTPPPVNFEKLFSTSHLLRIRRGDSTTTLFGGVDWPIIIASGRSNSPNFYSYRKGKAVLKYMRLSTTFFSMGYFYSEGLKREGSNYILHKKLSVPYYQPLPKNLRNAKGDYKLTPSIDGRFWNRMDFKNRPVSNVKTLETTVSLVETNGSNEITFEVTGQAGVPVTIELCFNEGGKLSGISEGKNDNSFLEKGMGEYEFGGDTIKFGPGALTHKAVDELEGERYSTHFGSLRTKGMHVYLTGVTPFTHKLTFS